jgi:hypothetical protein
VSAGPYIRAGLWWLGVILIVAGFLFAFWPPILVGVCLVIPVTAVWIGMFIRHGHGPAPEEESAAHVLAQEVLDQKRPVEKAMLGLSQQLERELFKDETVSYRVVMEPKKMEPVGITPVKKPRRRKPVKRRKTTRRK